MPEGRTSVFVGNLKYDDDDAIRFFFRDCGDICSIKWLYDRNTNAFKGCVFVELSGPDTSLELAVSSLDVLWLFGRRIKIQYSGFSLGKKVGLAGLASFPSRDSTPLLSSIYNLTASSVGSVPVSVESGNVLRHCLSKNEHIFRHCLWESKQILRRCPLESKQILRHFLSESGGS